MGTMILNLKPQLVAGSGELIELNRTTSSCSSTLSFRVIPVTTVWLQVTNLGLGTTPEINTLVSSTTDYNVSINMYSPPVGSTSNSAIIVELLTSEFGTVIASLQLLRNHNTHTCNL